MSTYLHDTHTPEEISMGYTSKDVPDVLKNLECATSAPVESNAGNCRGDADSLLIKRFDNSDAANIENAEPAVDSVKTYHVKEVPETSPFKQAVKGFVLNKLSKKVAHSHILSGLTGKLVKKLEEGKESSLVLNPNASFETSYPTPVLKESNTEGAFDSAPCELKSVVANESVVHELSSVEEAAECFEEAKTTVSDFRHNKKLNVERKILSKSLPSSPARQFGRRSSVGFDRSSDIEENSLGVESTSVPSGKLFQDLFVKASSLELEDGIELQEQKTNTIEQKGNISKQHSGQNPVDYTDNAFSIREGDGSRYPQQSLLSKYSHAFRKLRNIFLSLPFPHLILLASILIHNSRFLSSFYVHCIFDSLVIAYVGYTVICILMQTPTTNVTVHPVYSDTQLENASVCFDQVNKTMIGSAKILKGKYDPEENSLSTELVNISVENQLLKIFQIQINSKEIEDSSSLIETYDLRGGSISLVPKGLTRKRIFQRKYPICITLPRATKKSSSSLDVLEDLDAEEKTDYISLAPYADGLCETHKQKAIYLFALSDREKESWFWALLDNTSIPQRLSPTTLNIPQSVCSSEFDLSSISYSSLLDSNTDESLSITEDSSGKTTEIKLIPPSTSSLSFENYSKVLFENFERQLMLDYKTSEYSFNSDVTYKGSCSVEWLNVVLGRLCYDFLTRKTWSDYVINKIKKKLDKIELPSFVESLKVIDIDMGDSIPQFHSVSNPAEDSLGVWFDFDFVYKGSFQMTLQAKMKMPKGKQLSNTDVLESTDKQNNDVSDDDDEGTGSRTHSPTQSKLINKIEKWVSYKHFQAVAQSKFVKKYVGDISNMTLTLTVEVNKLQGVMAFNIPPVPSDRVWYGFRNDPVLSIAAYPKVGSHEINLSAVVQMIERQLVQAFKKALVMPNMDDIIIPIMFSPIYDRCM